MTIKIPDQLKSDLPQTFSGKVLGATPVVMTVVATMLAGLASSEMTRAQYERSLAAQQQSKSGDQWSFFQAKRLRASVQQGSFELLASTADIGAFDPAAVRAWASAAPASPGKTELAQRLASPAAATALSALHRGELPASAAPAPVDEQVAAVHAAIDAQKPDEQVGEMLDLISSPRLDHELQAAAERAAAFDAAMKPTTDVIDQIDRVLAAERQATAGTPQAEATRKLYRDFTAARLRLTSLRYDAEARLNQAIGRDLELQVRKSNRSAERHHTRSQRFFYGMLAAQMGVIISTFAMAARRRNLLWSLAAVAGVGAIAFAAYVFLAV